jgi:hypothetical protein
MVLSKLWRIHRCLVEGVPHSSQTLSPKEGVLLREAVAGLINDFGLGAVRQEIYRRPAPQAIGHPKTWNDERLFSLWLLVQAWVLYANCTTNAACKHLERIGGLTMYTYNGEAVLLRNAASIRKQFYKADAALKAYDLTLRTKSTPERLALPSLRERLEKNACSLSQCQVSFTNFDELACEIVGQELSKDLPDSVDAIWILIESEVAQQIGPAAPPASSTDRSELVGNTRSP